MKKSLLNLAALVGIALPASAQTAFAVPATVLDPVKMQCDSAYYAQFTYNWTDDAGQTHTARLTDVATNPRQIYAMIAKVYSDPKIPGKHKSSPVDGDVASGNWAVNTVTYMGKTGNHWPELNNTNTPEIDEQTTLLVEVKDVFATNGAQLYPGQATLADIYSCIKSVRLLYNAFRIERPGQAYDASNTAYKPGVLYNVSGTYNRFFLMGKGSNRSVCNLPFDRMFEQYSPTPGGNEDGGAPDFYQQLKSGQSYTVKHDCASVPHLKHYPTMASASGTAGAETMSNLVVFIPDYRLVNWSKRTDWCWYNPNYIPYFQVYDVHLTAKAERKGDVADRIYNVTLNWESNIDTLSDSRVKQDFYIYRVIDGVVDSKPLNAEPINDYSYTYPETQYSTGHTLTHIITAHPSGISGFNPVESNQASVLIPGYDPYELLALDIEGTSRCTYDPQKQLNDYANRITVDNNEHTYISGGFITEGTTFRLYRFDSDEQGGDSTLIATLVVDNITNADTQYRFNYTLKMHNQSVAVADSVGCLTAPTRDGAISFNGLRITDRFTASTAANDHKGHYDYVLEFMPVKAAGKAGVRMVHSNVVRLNVPKTEFSVGMKPFTKAQVDTDTDHSLELPDGIPMTVNAANSSAVRSYTLYRNGTAFGELQRAVNGTYSILTRSAGGKRPDQAVAEGLAAGQITATDDLRDATSVTATFYPVISSECLLADGSVGTNTYGADQKQASVLGVKVINPTTEKTSPFAYNANSWKMGFGCDFKAKGVFNNSIMGQYTYRVWRINDDGSETLLTEHLYDGNANPNVQDNYEFSIGEGELTVRDLFIDKPLKATDSKTVNYIVRLYCQSEDDQSKYYAAEDRFSVTFNAQIPTDIGAVQQPAAGVVSVRYIDATGRQSLTPVSGFNIVVTTHTDGTVTTAKRFQR